MRDVWTDFPATQRDCAARAYRLGWLDFRVLDHQAISDWLAFDGKWPVGKAVSAAYADWGLTEIQLNESSSKVEQERETQRKRRTQIKFAGQDYSALETDHATLIAAVRAGLSGISALTDINRSFKNLADVDPNKGSGGGSSGGSQSRGRRSHDAAMSDEQKKAIGLVGEIVARAWIGTFHLDRHQIEISDNCWVSRYRDEALGTDIGDFERMRSKNIGTKDFGRAKRLQELETQIVDPQRYGPAHYQLVEDCIEAALLDRGLGSPRDEVSGRFERAIRLAEKYGARVQLLRAKYLETWTNYWWFDDLAALRKGFLGLTSEFLEDATVWDIDYLVNLAIAVRSSYRVDGFELSQVHQATVKHIVDALEGLEAMTGQPTQAAWARTLLMFLKLLDAEQESERARLYAQFRQILKDVKFLPEYPIDSLLNWLAVLLEVAPMDNELARIAEDVANIKSTRAGVAAKVEVRVNLAIYRIRSIAVMTDEKLARKYAQGVLGLPVETTPRLYGYLHYHMHLGGADHDEVIKEHERFERRPLTSFFNQTFEDAMRCRLMANTVFPSAVHSTSGVEGGDKL